MNLRCLMLIFLMREAAIGEREGSSATDCVADVTDGNPMKVGRRKTEDGRRKTEDGRLGESGQLEEARPVTLIPNLLALSPENL